MNVTAILIGFIAAGLVLLGPRISDGIRARKQQDATDQAEAEAFFARVKAAEVEPFGDRAARLVNILDAQKAEAADPTSPANLRPIPAQRKEQP